MFGCCLVYFGFLFSTWLNAYQSLELIQFTVSMRCCFCCLQIISVLAWTLVCRRRRIIQIDFVVFCIISKRIFQHTINDSVSHNHLIHWKIIDFFFVRRKLLAILCHLFKFSTQFSRNRKSIRKSHSRLHQLTFMANLSVQPKETLSLYSVFNDTHCPCDKSFLFSCFFFYFGNFVVKMFKTRWKKAHACAFPFANFI